MRNIVLLTTCTNRKRRSVPDERLARNLPKGPIDCVAKEWVDRLRAAHFSENLMAGELYGGRGFREARVLAHNLASRLMIISAGCGLISSHDMVPPYGLTITPNSEDAIQRRIIEEMALPEEWWLALNQEFHSPFPISNMIRGALRTTFVFALSAAYFRLIGDELIQLDADELSRVRIAGLRPNEKIPKKLSLNTLPK